MDGSYNMDKKIVSTIKKELKYLVKYKVLLNVLKSMIIFANAIIVAKILNEALFEDSSEVVLLSLFLIGIIVVSNLITYFVNKKILLSENKKVQKCKEKLYELYIEKNYKDIAKDSYGDSKEHIIDDFNKVISRYTNDIPELISSLIIIILYFVYICKESLIMGITLFCISFIQVIVPVIERKYLVANYEKMRLVEAELTDYILASYSGFELMKVFGLEAWYLSGLQKIHTKYYKAGISAETISMTENVLNNMVKYILSYGVYAVVYGYIALDIISLETAAKTVVMAGTFFSCVKSMFSIIPDMSLSIAAAERMEKWVKNETIKPSEDTKIDNIKTIIVKKLKCKFNDKLIDIKELKINLEKKNILVGKNGSGKSTFAEIIMGECEYEGEVFFGETEEKYVQENILSKSYVYLKQQIPKLSITSYQLFRQQDSNIQEKSLENCREFGISEDEINNIRICDMSEGMRRKVFLSLILSYDSKSLILDEPTNDLDNYGKKILQAKLNQHSGGYLIITHEKEFIPYDYEYLFDGKGNVYVSEM